MNNKNNSKHSTNENYKESKTNPNNNSGISTWAWNPPGSDVTEENFDGGGDPGDSNLYLSIADRNSAVEINVGTPVNGCISEPGAEQFFKFTAPEQAVYSIYTLGDLDTIGYLYDSNGDLITLVDDHEPGGEINFQIMHTLAAAATYYLKVNLRNNDTGGYTLKIINGRVASSVKITPNAITLQHGVTYELPITPNYVYKGYNGARVIPNLSVSVSPSDADNKMVWWWAESNDILKCSYGWDDKGNRYIHVTVTGIGTAKLYAQDWNGNGSRNECTLELRYSPTYNKPTIHLRNEWNAADAITNRLVKRERNPERIIFHHPANLFSSTNIDDIKNEIKSIQNRHISFWDGNPKCDIAYHFLIDPAGGIWQGAEIDDYQRGHATGYYDDIGVSILGNFEPEDENDNSPNILNDEQKNAIKELSKWLCFEYNLKLDTEHGILPITTHRSLDSGTVCPGANAAPWIENELRNYIIDWYDI